MSFAKSNTNTRNSVPRSNKKWDYDSPEYKAHVAECKRRSYAKHGRKTKAGKEYFVSYNKRDGVREKVLARRAVNLAIISGALVKKPCEICGEPETEGHHEDYSKILEVRWLCKKHHAEFHRKDYKQSEVLRLKSLAWRVDLGSDSARSASAPLGWPNEPGLLPGG